MSLVSHVDQNNEREEPQTWVELPVGNRNKVVSTTVIKITCTLLLFPQTLSLFVAVSADSYGRVL